jgi:hypothetical protein
MKPDNSSAIPQEMEQARQQLEAWRSTHRPRCHIPDSLWKRAAELASQHGLYRTSRTLRVDYMRLKKLVQPVSPERKTAESPGFVELMAHSDGSHCGVHGGVAGIRGKDANPDEGHYGGGVGGIERTRTVGQHKLSQGSKSSASQTSMRSFPQRKLSLADCLEKRFWAA